MDNGWIEYRQLVISELQRLNNSIEKIEATLSQNSIEISRLRIFSVLYGSIGGALAITILRVVILKW